jgi:hypothetical protein
MTLPEVKHQPPRLRDRAPGSSAPPHKSQALRPRVCSPGHRLLAAWLVRLADAEPAPTLVWATGRRVTGAAVVVDGARDVPSSHTRPRRSPMCSRTPRCASSRAKTTLSASAIVQMLAEFLARSAGTGQVPRARELNTVMALPHPFDAIWLSLQVECAKASVLLDDPTPHPCSTNGSLPMRAAPATVGRAVCSYGAIDRPLGGLAALLGRPTDAMRTSKTPSGSTTRLVACLPRSCRATPDATQPRESRRR